jgi:hypothetical protein
VNNIDDSHSKVNLRARPLRASLGGCRPDPSPARRNPIDWKFDAPPRDILKDIRRGKLSRIDKDVLGVAVRYRTIRKDSAWVTKRTIADELGVTPRHVQSSIARLVRFRWIDHVEVGREDPDDPRNKTGWRWVFLWVTEVIGKVDHLKPEDFPAWANPSLIARGGEKGLAPIPSTHPTTSPFSRGEKDRASIPGPPLLPTIKEPKEREKTETIAPFVSPLDPPVGPDPSPENARAIERELSLSLSDSENSPSTETTTPDLEGQSTMKDTTGIIRDCRLAGYELQYRVVDGIPKVGATSTAAHLKGKPLPMHLQRDVTENREALLEELKPKLEPMWLVERNLRAKKFGDGGSPAIPKAEMDLGTIGAQIDELVGNPDESLAEKLADRLVVDLREKDPARSRAMYVGMARDVRNKQWPATILKDALEAASQYPGQNPGKVVTRRVQDAVRVYRGMAN